jgi:hypothetical protein
LFFLKLLILYLVYFTTTNVEYKIRVDVCSTVAEDNDKNQKIDQENKCKIEIENEHGDNNEQNNNDNEVTCQNSAQNGYDTSINGNPFSELGPG